MMNPAAIEVLQCPLCQGAFELEGRSVRCAARHTFDLARQGYLNLLGGPEPGNADTAAMLGARERVHASGLFSEIGSRIAHLLTGQQRILEVGSGTAYYLRRSLGPDADRVGIALDVSKAAARHAARSDPRIAAVVADVWRPLPIRADSLHALICAFAPRNLPEFARVLRTDGRLIIVTPRAEHLAGLRDQHGLLSVPTGKDQQIATAAAEFFKLQSTTRYAEFHQISAETATDLIAMGPNAFHRAPQVMRPTPVNIDVEIQCFTPLRG